MAEVNEKEKVTEEVAKKQPSLGITLVAVLFGLGGIGAIITGILMLLGVAVPHEFRLFGVIYVILGGAEIYIARGLYRLEPWAWVTALVITVVDTLGKVSIWLMVGKSTLLGILIDAVIIILLLTNAQHFGYKIFGKPAKTPATATTFDSRGFKFFRQY